MNRKLTPLGVKFWWNCPWVVVDAEEILWNQACFGPFKTMNYAYKTLMKSSVGQTIGQKQQSSHQAKGFASFWRKLIENQVTFET